MVHAAEIARQETAAVGHAHAQLRMALEHALEDQV
jgi:hypothetical protein